MLNTFNKLRILGTNDEVLEIKAFLEQTKGDKKNKFDLTRVTSNFKGEIDQVEIGYDTILFKSNESVLPVLIELSKRFGEVKLAYQMVSEKKTKDQFMEMIEQEKAHYLISNGDIVSESKSSGKQAHTKKYEESQKKLEGNKKQEVQPSSQDVKSSKNELVSQESLYDLQEKFFKDIQDFMKDFTKSFFNHWF
jgi:hypothetical protein